MNRRVATAPSHTIEAEDRPSPDSAAALASDNAPLTIAEVARDFGITARALRFYESKRLIAPQRFGATRLYSRQDRDRLALILTGRRLGFTLAEVKELIASASGAGGALGLTREKCVEQINLLDRQKRALELAIAELRQIYTSFYRKRIEAAGAHHWPHSEAFTSK
jgi:DNA-binding transcriptional MerR regulator